MKEIVGIVSYASGEVIEFTDSEKYISTVKEELPYSQTSRFTFKTHTTDPYVRKSVDDLIYNLYGEENPNDIEFYENKPKNNFSMGGMI